MGDNDFHEWFRDFIKETFLEVWGNPNASAQQRSEHTSQSATEPAASDASELHRHQWLHPDNGVLECATCGATRNHYGD